MSRQARCFSETGLYHVVFRGVNHCHLFEEDFDYEKFLLILKNVKEELHFELYAYCFMSNHVHLLIYEKNLGDIVRIMKKILTIYAGWFNRKYMRSGALISNRYKSKCINIDDYLISLVKYIHQNPVKAGIVEKPVEYVWSSYHEYLNDKCGVSDHEFIYAILSTNKKIAIKKFIEIHETIDHEEFVPTEGKRKTENEVRREIIKFMNGKEPNDIGKLSKEERNIILRGLRESGLSIRQIERATGISRGIIAKS